jgi:hypothetical protein
MLASTKYSRRQNAGFDKILASTKYSRRQNTHADRNLASTKSRIDKMLAHARMHLKLFGLAESTASDFSQTSLMFSYVSQKVLIPPHGVAKCADATRRPAFMGGLSPALYWLIVPAPPGLSWNRDLPALSSPAESHSLATGGSAPACTAGCLA